MRMMTEAEEKRLTMLEQQTEALLIGRERMSNRIMLLRKFIAQNCTHGALEPTCPVCKFLEEDANG